MLSSPIWGSYLWLVPAKEQSTYTGKSKLVHCPLRRPRDCRRDVGLRSWACLALRPSRGESWGSWRRFSSQDIFFLRGFITVWDLSMWYRNRILFDLGPRQRDKWWGKPSLLDDLASTSTSACFVLPRSLHVLNHNTQQRHKSDNVDPSISDRAPPPMLSDSLRIAPPLLRVAKRTKPFCPALWPIHASLRKLCTSCTSRLEIFFLLLLSLN